MMLQTSFRKPVSSYFVPDSLLLNSEKNGKGICQLIAACALEAIDMLEKGNLIQLDAHAGNYGCEAHSFRLLHLARSKELRLECTTLRIQCESILAAIKNPHLQFKELFDSHIARLTVTPEMGYLMQARLLTITKKMCVGSDGYETEKTVPARLRTLASTVNKHCLSEIVSFAQESLSRSSIQFLGEQVSRYASVGGEEKRIVCRMFEQPNLVLYSGRKEDPRLKTFSCAFFTVKAVLLHIKEAKTAVVIKPLNRAGEEPSPGLLFRASGSHLMPCGGTEPREPVIVCEGITSLKLAELAEKINHYGLEKILLANAALGEQYVPNHAEFQVNDPQAKAEIVSWRHNAEELQKVFNFVHMYCSTREKEAVLGGQHEPAT